MLRSAFFHLVTIKGFLWLTYFLFALSATTSAKSPPRRSSPNLMTRSRRPCRRSNTRPARIIWFASSSATATPTIRRTMYTPAPPPMAGNGAPPGSSARMPCRQFMPVPRPSPRRLEPASSAADSSPWAASKTTQPKSSTATSKPWPSPRPTASTCYALPASITSNSSCCMKIPVRSIPCSRPAPMELPPLKLLTNMA